jgi:hypothetical protein
VGGGLVVADVEGGLVGGGLVVDDVLGGMVGGGIVGTVNVGKVGNSGNSGNSPGSGIENVGTLVGGPVWAPADDISNPALPALTATSATTRRFQTRITNLPHLDNRGPTIYPGLRAPVPSGP